MAIKAKKVQPAKTKAIEEAKQILGEYKSYIFVDYRGLTVEQITKLRDNLREKDATLKLVVDLEEDNDSSHSGQAITFKIADTQSINATTLDAEHDNVEYNNSGEPVAKTNIAGSITISSIKINTSSASLKNTLNKEAEFVRGQTTTKTIFDGTYTAKK